MRQGNAFILRLHALKNMSAQHLGIHQQLDGIINCRTAHTKTITLDHLLQLLDSEVTINGQNAVQNGIALGGPAHTTGVQEIIELAHNRVVAAS